MKYANRRLVSRLPRPTRGVRLQSGKAKFVFSTFTRKNQSNNDEIFFSTKIKHKKCYNGSYTNNNPTAPEHHPRRCLRHRRLLPLLFQRQRSLFVDE